MINNPLMPDERKQQLLQQMLNNQMQPGPKSVEHKEKTLQDATGRKMSLGVELKGVFIDSSGLPHVASEQRIVTLHCGHTVDLSSTNIQQCSYGHVICYRHELSYCADCRRPLCMFDIQVDETGKILCPYCEKRTNWWIYFMVIGLMCMLVAFIRS